MFCDAIKQKILCFKQKNRFLSNISYYILYSTIEKIKKTSKEDFETKNKYNCGIDQFDDLCSGNS